MAQRGEGNAGGQKGDVRPLPRDRPGAGQPFGGKKPTSEGHAVAGGGRRGKAGPKSHEGPL